MQPDLQGLEITQGELKKLSNVSAISLGDYGDNFWASLFNEEFPIVYFIIIFVVFIAWILAPLKLLGIILGFLIVCSGLSLFFYVIKMDWVSKRSLRKLRNEVEKHNEIIKNIDVLDQLEAAGNPVSLNDRVKVIEAIKITRNELVRALNTERILRENPKFKPEQFAIDLTSLRALQVSEQASEWGRLLNETLQVAVDVQTEMRKLQDRR